MVTEQRIGEIKEQLSLIFREARQEARNSELKSEWMQVERAAYKAWAKLGLIDRRLYGGTSDGKR